MDILLKILGILCAVVVGWKLHGLWFKFIMAPVLKDLGITYEEVLRVARKNGIDVTKEEAALAETYPVLEVRVEKVKDMLYAYRREDDVFLAQAKTKEDLLERLRQQVKGTVKLTARVEEGGRYLEND
jgi:hypothetical protein